MSFISSCASALSRRRECSRVSSTRRRARSRASFFLAAPGVAAALSVCLTLLSLPVLAGADDRPGLATDPGRIAQVDAMPLGPGLESVVITATRTATPLERTLADVTVIDSRQIRDAGEATLPELLRNAGGIEISQNGGPGTVSGVFLRGTRASQTVILVDGIRMENPTSGGGLPEYIPLSAIERIEIVRGPASVLYGSGAIGGVVQIFTRQAGTEGVTPFASVGLGSRGTRSVLAGLRGRAGDTGFSFSLADERTDGFNATLPLNPDYRPDRDGNHVRSATASLTHRLNEAWRLGANFLVSDGRVYVDFACSAFSCPSDELSRADYRSSAVSAFATGRLASSWETTLRVGNTSLDYDYPAFDSTARTDSRTVSWLNTIDAAGAQWLFGMESLGQQIAGLGLTRGSAVYSRDTRNTDSVFGQWQRDFGAHEFRVAVRRDRIQAVGAETTGALGWGWQLRPEWLVRAGWASAFRAPTFDDLYNPWSANPTLRPERSRGVEAALEWHGGSDLFKATVFSNRIRDAIELDANFVAQNLEVATVRGVTFESQRRMGDFTLRGSVTFQQPHAERTDPVTGVTTTRELSRRARRHASVGLGWKDGPWRLGADAIAQGERFDPNGMRMGGYAFVDLRAAYAVDRQWELFARLANATDREFETAAGYRTGPRTLLVGVRYERR